MSVHGTVTIDKELRVNWKPDPVLSGICRNLDLFIICIISLLIRTDHPLLIYQGSFITQKRCSTFRSDGIILELSIYIIKTSSSYYGTRVYKTELKPFRTWRRETYMKFGSSSVNRKDFTDIVGYYYILLLRHK